MKSRHSISCRESRKKEKNNVFCLKEGRKKEREGLKRNLSRRGQRETKGSAALVCREKTALFLLG